MSKVVAGSTAAKPKSALNSIVVAFKIFVGGWLDRLLAVKLNLSSNLGDKVDFKRGGMLELAMM